MQARNVLKNRVLSSTVVLLIQVNVMCSGHQDYFYQPEDGYMFPKPYKGQSLISYLESRSYDTGAELDKVKMRFCGLSIFSLLLQSV